MWTPSVRALAELHETYVDAVNRAVADGRDELVERLAAEYAEERLRLLLPPAAGAPAA